MDIHTDAAHVEAPAEVNVVMVHACLARAPDVALCGKPLSGAFADGEPVECVVCAELDRELKARA